MTNITHLSDYKKKLWRDDKELLEELRQLSNIMRQYVESLLKEDADGIPEPPTVLRFKRR